METEVIKRSRALNKPNKYKPESDDDEEDEEENKPTKGKKTPKFAKFVPGELHEMASKNEFQWEVCVACYLDFKKRCVEGGEAIPENLFRLFSRSAIKSDRTLLRNHKILCYKHPNSNKKCCDAEDARVLAISLPWERSFVGKEHENNHQHVGKFQLI